MMHNLKFVCSGWKKMTVDVSTGKIPTVAGPDWAQLQDDGGGSTGVYAYAFDKAAEESVFFSNTEPGDFQLLADFYVTLEWSAPTTQTDCTVCWGLESSSSHAKNPFSPTNLYGNPYHTGSPPTTVTGRGWHRTILGPIGGETYIDRYNTLVFRVFRDATGSIYPDTYNYDAYLLGFQVFYRSQTHALKDLYL